MKVEIEINSCYECPNVSNNCRDHDDPFTSSPAKTIWYCKILENLDPYGSGYFLDNKDIHRNIIPSKCPLKNKK
jgi:hypothetical protein